MLGLFGVMLSVVSTWQLPVEVDGEGYFSLKGSKKTTLKKSCTLCVKDNRLSSTQGEVILPEINIPGKPSQLYLDKLGNITGKYGNKSKILGKVALSIFQNDEIVIGANGLGESAYCMVYPGNDGAGFIKILKQNVPGKKSGGKGIQITLKDYVELDVDGCTLGDIAEIRAPEKKFEELKNILIVSGFQLGREKQISELAVKNRLIVNGLANNTFTIDGAKQCTIKRNCEVIENEAFIDAALDALEEEYGDRDYTLQKNSSQTGIVVSPGNWELTVENVYALGKKINVKVAIYVDGRRKNSRTITFIKKALQPVVKKNSSVKIKVESGGVCIHLVGKALQDGFLNKYLEVEIEKGNCVTGLVKKGNIVEVKI